MVYTVDSISIEEIKPCEKVFACAAESNRCYPDDMGEIALIQSSMTFLGISLFILLISCIIRKTTSNIYKSIEKDDTVVLKWNQDSDDNQEETQNNENDIQVHTIPAQSDDTQ